MNNIVILGGGITGLGCAYKLKRLGIRFKLFEKEVRSGGLCRNLKINNYIFDRFIHLSFTNNEEIKNLFLNSANEVIIHNPNPYNYYNKIWTIHPLQNDIYEFPEEQKNKIIESFSNKICNEDPKNYKEWLEAQYGKYFTDEFVSKYTRKYWTLNPDKMSIDWIGYRVITSNIDEIKKGAYNRVNINKYYAKEVVYPKKGGFESFFRKWENSENILFNYNLIKWDNTNKILLFDNGQRVSYKKIISTLPLNYIINIMTNVPQNIRDASNDLAHTSGYTVSIGIKGKLNINHLWFYIYDEDILFARVYTASMKSSYNSPKGCSSLQAEIYCSKFKDIDLSEKNIKEHTVNKLVEMKIFELEQLEFVQLDYNEYANILFTINTEKNKRLILEWLEHEGVVTAGRYGKWEYLWSDQSIISGFDAVNKILK